MTLGLARGLAGGFIWLGLQHLIFTAFGLTAFLILNA